MWVAKAFGAIQILANQKRPMMLEVILRVTAELRQFPIWRHATHDLDKHMQSQILIATAVSPPDRSISDAQLTSAALTRSLPHRHLGLMTL